jgi:uncharacterized protein (TIGR02757 family)
LSLKKKLDYHYRAFDKSQISPDPLQFLHLYENEKDIEAIGFLASIFAYGNVAQIINTLDMIILAADNNPYDFILNYTEKNVQNKIKKIKHRFYTAKDINTLFLLLNSIYKNYGNIKTFYLENFDASEKTVEKSLNIFSKRLLEGVAKISGGKISHGVKFMFPMPASGSACKRMNLFLRWMVRKDELDFGLWKEILTDKLIIPVDTHVARICRKLNLTTKKNVSWKMAEEITNNLKKFDRNDPVKYDFAICHIGMRKIIF